MNKSKLNIVVRWSARIIGLLLISLFLLIFFGEGPPNYFKLEPTEQYMFIALFIYFAGLIAGWKWELAGGLVAMAGVLAFYIINFIASGKFPDGPVFPLFFIPGILYLISWGLDKKRGRKHGSASTN